MSRDWTWKSSLFLLVLAMHLWLGWTLANFRPENTERLRFKSASSPPEELVLVLTFSSRTDVRSTSTARPAKATAPLRARKKSGAATSLLVTEGHGQVSTEPGPDAPFILGPPAPPLTFPEPDMLQQRSVLEYRPTRFAHAWLSDGSLTEVVARRSMLAGVLLGALGALKKPCTELQRSHYDPACVPDQYRHSADGD